MTMRRPPGAVARRVDFLANGWRAEEVAVLWHASLPWVERAVRGSDPATEPLESAASWGERDRLSLLGQVAAHLAFVRAAGISWGRFAAEEWSASRKRSDDARLLRLALRDRGEESASSFLCRAAALLRAPRLASLEASWVKPDAVYAEIDVRLRSGPRTRRWLRGAAFGSVLSPRLAAAQQIAEGIPARLAGEDESMIDAVRALASLLPDPPRLFEIGGPSATPLRPFSAVAALGDFASLQPGEEAAALDRVDASVGERGAILMLRRGERFDASSAHLLRLLASGRRDLSWVIAGEMPPSLDRAVEPERAPDTLLFVVSPVMSARRDLLRLVDPVPLQDRAAWLRGFVQREQFDRFLDEGLIPPAPAIESTEEPRRSYLAALAIAGQQVPAAAASVILRELGWLRPPEELASPALAQIDASGVEFRSAAIQRALADSLPDEARPGLCALAAAALAPLDRWRSKLLELEAGEASAAGALGGPLDERERRELGATISRLPPSLRDSRAVVELHARALLEEGRYRLAREEAARLGGDERALLTARIERVLATHESQ